MKSGPKTVSVFNVRDKTGRVLPVVVAEDAAGVIRVVPEVACFLRDMHGTLSSRRAAASVLGFLHDFLVTTQNGEPIDPVALPDVIQQFLYLRRGGDQDNQHGLGWVPSKMSTVARDARVLRLFSEYCAEKFKHIPFMGLQKYGISDHENLSNRMASQDPSRSWRRVEGAKGPSRAASIAVERHVVRTDGAKHVLTFKQVLEIFEAANSHSLRATILLCAFGGIRASEALNIWATDVMPGSERERIFPSDSNSDLPLVVLAHPSQSVFVSKLEQSQKGVDRLRHLSEKYGLVPRNLDQSSPLHAGWKGMYYDNQKLLVSQIYWTSPEMASLFVKEIGSSRASVIKRIGSQRLDSHPYLLVNDSPKSESLGLPTKMSNLLKGYERACRKAGIPAEYGRGIHALRHFYKATLEDLDIRPEHRRIAMHHINIVSQESYAASAARTSAAIADAIKGRLNDS